MRHITITLATLGLLFLGATLAAAQEPFVNAATVSQSTVAVDQAVVTPVRWYGYVPYPGWRAYRYPYYVYRPRYYGYGPPRYYDYYYDPYADYPNSYYYPGGFSFGYYGPRRSFNFGF